MFRFLLLILLLYVVFRLARFVFRILVLPFLRSPVPPSSASPPEVPREQRSSIDPTNIRDAEFTDLPPDTKDKSE